MIEGLKFRNYLPRDPDLRNHRTAQPFFLIPIWSDPQPPTEDFVKEMNQRYDKLSKQVDDEVVAFSY